MPAWRAKFSKNCCNKMAGPGFHLRPARANDAKHIRRLIWQVHINPTGLDWHHFWVAVDSQDRLLGCGQLKPHADDSLELASIAVHPQQRGLGIAHAIMAQLLSLAGRPLYLRCAAPMQPFYERFGFQVIPMEEMPPSFQRDWKIVVWMRKYLFHKLSGFRVMRLDNLSSNS
jgi:N-acetylglutamate synthase-like GNAT family acetyltransferase